MFGTVITVGLAVLAFFIAYWLYVLKGTAAKAGISTWPGKWMLAAYGVDTGWRNVAILPIKVVGTWFRDRIDQGILAAVVGVANGIWLWAEDLRPVQSGYVRRYGLSIMVGLGVILAYCLTRV